MALLKCVEKYQPESWLHNFKSKHNQVSDSEFNPKITIELLGFHTDTSLLESKEEKSHFLYIPTFQFRTSSLQTLCTMPSFTLQSQRAEHFSLKLTPIAVTHGALIYLLN